MNHDFTFDFEWRDVAACTSFEQDLFFPAGETGRAAADIDKAKGICGDCPAQMECLDYAVTTGQRFGVWGGTDENERRLLRRRWVAAQRNRESVDFVGWLSRAS